jgi:chloramphenicol 3-O-phosphotransferase
VAPAGKVLGVRPRRGPVAGGLLRRAGRPGPRRNQVVTAASGLDDQAGWRRRLAGIGCLFTGLTPALAVCEQRERGRDDRADGNAAREWHAVHQGWAYDLAIDTGAVDPRRAAALVLAALADGKARTA